jgi:hypothetical protein
MSDDEAPTRGEPLELMTDEDIVRYARGIITNEYMLGDARDHDWSMSLMLLIGGWNPVPSNASTLFLVPMDEHMSGRWINGRVPGVTLKAQCVPMENVEALLAKCDEFYRSLHPEATVTPETRLDET